MSKSLPQAPDDTSSKSLYPTYDSLQQAEQAAEAALPIKSTNVLKAILGAYKNTLNHVRKKHGETNPNQ